MPVRFLISTLKPGVDPAEYEAWVRERDYALVRSKPNYVSYTVHRIRQPIPGAPDVGLAVYRADRGQAVWNSMTATWLRRRAWRCARNSTAGSWIAPRTSISPATRSNRPIDVSKPHCPGCSSKGIWNVMIC